MGHSLLTVCTFLDFKVFICCRSRAAWLLVDAAVDICLIEGRSDSIERSSNKTGNMALLCKSGGNKLKDFQASISIVENITLSDGAAVSETRFQ